LLGEGGALFVLEPLEQALAAGRSIWAEIVGTGVGQDAAHPTRTAPDGRGLVFALRRALQEAALAPSHIDYLNAHSPGTAINDIGEAAAIRTVFGAHGVPVSSTKGALGHSQGGANALEPLACILALQHQLAPPTLNVDTLDAALGLDVIVQPRPLVMNHALSIAAAMGGANAVVIFARGC
jgi:3-oxoacyl-[acyl-carrier-protein] synthase II